jgi:D-sedoheptulose 7-phosphate isomerase
MPFAADYKTLLVETLDRLDLARIETAIEWFDQARREGRQIFVCGNGGSAATASHFACDIVKGASFGHEKRFRILALTDNLATITAYANDVSYDAIFAEQLRNFARSGDLVVAISGSGNSPNVVRAIETAKEIGCRTIAMTGRDGGKLAPLADLNIHAPSPHMGRIEDAHMIACHMIAYRFMEHSG